MADTSAPMRPVASGSSVLALGAHRFDIAHRALIMGTLIPVAGAPVSTILGSAEALLHDGADILELGGAAEPEGDVGDEEAIDRVVPAIEHLHARFDVPICIETHRPAVARACFGAGASIGNDRRGDDPAYLAAVASHGAAVVLAGPPPEADPDASAVPDALPATRQAQVADAEAAGIPRERILVDAGLDGGAWRARLRATGVLAGLGCPIVVSPPAWSRPPAGGRGMDADASAELIGVIVSAIGLGGRILRVDQVRVARRVADTMAAILGAP